MCIIYFLANLARIRFSQISLVLHLVVTHRLIILTTEDSQGTETGGGLMFWTVTCISPRKPCYDGLTSVTEKALGAGSRLRTVSHLLPHQHTQTGGANHSGPHAVRSKRFRPSHPLESPLQPGQQQSTDHSVQKLHPGQDTAHRWTWLCLWEKRLAG